MQHDAQLSVKLKNEEFLEIKIYAERKDSIRTLSRADAEDHGEAEVQLTEGSRYEYKLNSPFILRSEGGIISPSRAELKTGRIEPGIYVGTLKIDVYDEADNYAGSFNLEVVSRKTNYRSEYRYMLGEITEKCTDLLMQYTSPANQPFDIEHNSDSKTLYQRFAFISSVIKTDTFAAAVHRITSSPVTHWEQTPQQRDIRSVRKTNRSIIRQFAGAARRVPLPERHALNRYMQSVPQRVITQNKKDSVDTAENRFIKYALETFKTLCGDFKSKSRPETRLHIEASHLEEQLEEYLHHSIFQKISRPATLPLNSPVLQRKEGYREILRVWLLTNLAARLTWKGGENVYRGGKRDVATLYEYWLFFKLTELIEDVFSINAMNAEDMIEETHDGLGLKLRQGKYLPLEGIYKSGTRKLHVQFSFNKQFRGGSTYPKGGSWTRSMRPDYTLSIWPHGINDDEAEEQELIVHLHFDAKYKVENLTGLFGEDSTEESLNEEKKEQNQGIYKRADLLKIHAYRDSIRRTAGAYILYPGDKKYKWRGYHEIIPGLGAFNIKPHRDNDGSDELRTFLSDVVQHFENRISQREKQSFQTYRIFKSPGDKPVKEPLPETFGENRSLIPDESFVLVGFYKNEDHFEWIKTNGLYNARAGSIRGSLRLSRGETEATFILLHSDNELETDKLFEVKKTGPRVLSKEDLLSKGYPGTRDDQYYLVYDVKPNNFEELKNIQWDIRELSGYRKGRASALPFTTTLAELMNAKINK